MLIKGARKDITGRTFNHLTALKSVRLEKRSDGHHKTIWMFLCDCGKTLECDYRLVVRGNKKSCGCHVRHGDEVTAWHVFCKGYNDGDLTLDQFMQLSRQNCYYCGAKPCNSQVYHGRPAWVYNGLDRLNNDQPHNKNNVVPCCWPCNNMKSNQDLQDFIKKIRTIYFNTCHIKTGDTK